VTMPEVVHVRVEWTFNEQEGDVWGDAFDEQGEQIVGVMASLGFYDDEGDVQVLIDRYLSPQLDEVLDAMVGPIDHKTVVMVDG
jgi:hypothetical protein